MNIIALSGSLRKDSYTTKLVKALKAQAPDGIELAILDISNLPLLNEDLEENLPQSVKDLRTAISAADGVIFATPEYNRSYSPVIKNAIDWGSRPSGFNSWDGKPVGIVGATPFNLGAFGAVQHLRQVTMYLNMPTLQQPEFYLSRADEKFNEDGSLTDAHTKEKIDEFWGAFIPWAQATA